MDGAGFTFIGYPARPRPGLGEEGESPMSRWYWEPVVPDSGLCIFEYVWLRPSGLHH